MAHGTAAWMGHRARSVDLSQVRGPRRGTASPRPVPYDARSHRPWVRADVVRCARACRILRRRSLWLDEASASRRLAVRRSATSAACPRRSTTRASSRCSPARCARSRPRSSAAARCLGVRTKFQVVALLVREERARIKADTEMHRGRSATEQLKRLDGIATILAKTAARDTSLLALLAEDAVVSDAAQALKREMLARRRARGRRRGARARQPTAPVGRRRAPQVVPQSVDLPPAGQPVPRPGLLARRRADRDRRPPAGRLGAARPAVPVLRDGRGRRARPACRCPSRASLARPRRPRADAAPGAGRRGRGGRPPHVPARRRARSRQDRPGAARRPGRQRLPAAGRRAQRRQDQLGARGRAVDPARSRPPWSTATARPSTASPTS